MKLTPTILLLVLLSGCQSPPPRVTNDTRTAKDAAQAAQDAIEAARKEAYMRYLECSAQAEARYNAGLKLEGTPVPGRKGVYAERYRGAFDKLREQRNFEDTECRKIYEAELGLIQPHAQEQTK